MKNVSQISKTGYKYKNIFGWKIHAVYFSSKKHFPYLLISLKSLLRLNSTMLGNIYLYIDRDDFFSTQQLNILHQLSHNFQIRKTQCIIGYGKEYILSELSAFGEVSQEISKEDYIMKVDSDIIFLNDKIFHTVIGSKNILIGHEEMYWCPFTYVQGGCYFLHASFIFRLCDFDINIFEDVMNKMKAIRIREVIEGKYPEDAVVYSIVQSKTDKILFVSCMDFFYSTHRTEATEPSVIHFKCTKILMSYFYRDNKIWFEILYFFYKIINICIVCMKKIGNFLVNTP